MKCTASRELLALYVEGDLPVLQSEKIKAHVTNCPDCEKFCQDIQQSQRVFKTLRLAMPDAAALAGVRHGVLARTENPASVLGWPVRIERFLLAGFRRPRYAAAAIAIVAILSGSLVGQLQKSAADTTVHAAVFEGGSLMRPTSYRDWIFVGNSAGHNVYIDPAAYQQYSRTGEFPDGTVLIREMAPTLEASVKDSSRFEGGWGYFGFTGQDGKLKDRAEVFPESAGCRSCHEQKAERDHVFTQFYPVLRSVGAILAP